MTVHKALSANEFNNNGSAVMHGGYSSSVPTIDFGNTFETVVQPMVSGLTFKPITAEPFNQGNASVGMFISDMVGMNGVGVSNIAGSPWVGYYDKNKDFVPASGLDAQTGPGVDKAANPTYQIPGRLVYQDGTGSPVVDSYEPRTL